jgi:dTDP-4-dehydrorhamnose 3,5-epimerase
MKFTPVIELPGLWMIDLEKRADERGYFARSYCEQEFSSRGLNTRWPQSNLTLTLRRGMLRGLHFQAEPKPEIKVVRCFSGAVCDVAVDLRRGSPTFGRWKSFELSAENGRALYIPAGFAHGFQCLSDHCQLFYQMSEFYFQELARGVRWNDRALKIAWPLPDPFVSEKDLALPAIGALCEADLTVYEP